jgi:hypothetical protein
VLTHQLHRTVHGKVYQVLLAVTAVCLIRRGACLFHVQSGQAKTNNESSVHLSLTVLLLCATEGIPHNPPLCQAVPSSK